MQKGPANQKCSGWRGTPFFFLPFVSWSATADFHVGAACGVANAALPLRVHVPVGSAATAPTRPFKKTILGERGPNLFDKGQ